MPLVVTFIRGRFVGKQRGTWVLAAWTSLLSYSPLRAQVAAAFPAATLSDPTAYSKYAALAITPDGATSVAYTVWRPAGGDQLYLRTRPAGGTVWSAPVRLDAAGQGVESYASLAAGRRPDELWVVWQGRRQGRWAVYARHRLAGHWQPEVRLSKAGTPAWHPKALTDAGGRVWVAWEQPGPGPVSALVVRTLAPGSVRWARPTAITRGGLNRRIALAPAPSGRLWLAYDAPAQGNYDIWLTRLRPPGSPSGPVRPDTLAQVTRDASTDDSPSLASAPDGTLWLAWNSLRGLRGEADPANQHAGGIFLRAWRGGRWLSPPAVAAGLLPGQVNLPGIDKNSNDEEEATWHWKQSQNYPALHLDPGGQRLWVLWRTDPTGGHNFDLVARVYDPTPAAGGWSPLLPLTTYSPGRDEWPALVSEPDGRVRMAWEGQVLPPPGEEARYQGGFVDAYDTRANQNVILTARLPRPDSLTYQPASLAPAPPEVFDPAAGADPPQPGPAPGGAARTQDGRYRLYFGDLHSHSVLSDAKYGWPDQVLWLGRQRGLDFALVSDHAEMGRLQASEAAELRQLAEQFTQPGRFVNLLGFEWTATPAYGHRIVVYPGLEAPTYSSALPEANTIEKLYALLRPTGAAISTHHPGQAAWGRWNPLASYDPVVEPTFEISSWHGRAEYYGNPREGRRQVPGHQYQDALRLGRPLGVLGGSDTHHLSPGTGGLTVVLADTLTASAVVEAVRQRRTYATTGARIVLDVTLNGQPVGSRLALPVDTACLHVRVVGTAPLDRVEVVRDLQASYVLLRLEQVPGTTQGVFYRYDPAQPQGGQRLPTADLRQASFTFRDPRGGAGRGGAASYYVRVTQVDGQQAWSSPIWLGEPAASPAAPPPR